MYGHPADVEICWYMCTSASRCGHQQWREAAPKEVCAISSPPKLFDHRGFETFKAASTLTFVEGIC